jgi:aryl-alcohol dehydrogenase-like predicted oxidoreductase
MHRDFERDILPMARHFGMALAPWDVLGGGHFQSPKQLAERKESGEGLRGFFTTEQTEDERRISEALFKVAVEHGIQSVTTIALAYTLCKAPYVFPIVGGRKVEHLQDNIQALSIHLTDKQIEFLESAIPFDVGFPTNLIGKDPKTTDGKAAPMTITACHLDFVISPRAIGYELGE